MALSFISYASAAATSRTLPTFAAGDLGLVHAYRDGSDAPPSLPAGWTDIASSGANSNSSRVGFRVLQGGDTSTGVWTNATEVQVIVLRGQHATAPIGASVSPNGTISSSVTYGPVQIFGDPAQSWVVAFAGSRTATDVNTALASAASDSFFVLEVDGTSLWLLENSVTDAWLLENAMTNRSLASSTTSIGAHTHTGLFTLTGSEYWFDATSFTINTSAAWRSYAFEVVAANVNTRQTATAVLSLAPGGVPAVRTGHSLNIRARKTNEAHTGVMRVQLFENNTPRSALLSTSPLTTALTTYSLPLTEAEATAIGSYAELEVRFDGYSSEGTTTVFEVDQVWLEMSPAATVTSSTFPRLTMLSLVESWAAPPPPVDENIYPSPTLYPSETGP